MSYDGAMQSGDRLGEYVLQELIGEGGFGEVWKAQTPDYPSPVVAIKIPTKPDCNEATSPCLQEAYYCAARAQVQLSHPDIAFADLEQAIGLGFEDQLRLQTEPDLAPLRKDPRWKKMLDRLNR